MLENGFFIAMKGKNTELMWNYGKRCLTIDGGYEKVNNANKILTNMFRYKPSTITKE
jgi:hypothetical protein